MTTDTYKLPGCYDIVWFFLFTVNYVTISGGFPKTVL